VSSRKRKLVPWSSAEEESLVNGVGRFGEEKWDEIRSTFASVLGHRTNGSLKSRWRKIQKETGKQAAGQNSKKRARGEDSVQNIPASETDDDYPSVPISLDGIADEAFYRIAEYSHGTSLCGVAKLCKEIGVVSTELRRKCHCYMTAIPLDINMDEIATVSRKSFTLPALLWVIHRRARLRSFIINCSEADHGFVTHVLRACDTSLIEVLSIATPDGAIARFCSEATSIVQEYWYSINDGAIVIDELDEIHSEKSWREKAFECGVPSNIVDSPSTQEESLFSAIAQEAVSLKKLHFPAYLREGDSPPDFLTKLESLLELKVCIVSSRRIGVYGTTEALLTIEWLGNIIKTMKSLRNLTLLSSYLFDTLFWLESDTLEEIEFTGMGKNNWVEKVICPSLKLFVSRGSICGNGIRQTLPRDDSICRENYDTLNIGPGDHLACQMPCEGVQVPDSCVFRFCE